MFADIVVIHFWNIFVYFNSILNILMGFYEFLCYRIIFSDKVLINNFIYCCIMYSLVFSRDFFSVQFNLMINY